MQGLPPAWSAAVAQAQRCCSAGDVQGLNEARVQARLARQEAFRALKRAAEPPPPERPAFTAGMRLKRRVVLRKAERRRRFLRMHARLTGAQPAPAPSPQRLAWILKRQQVLGRLVDPGSDESASGSLDGPSLPVELDRPRPGGGLVALGAACLPGLNGARLGIELRDGSLAAVDLAETRAILDDLDDLGVGILRHPGTTELDLTVGALFGEPLPAASEIGTVAAERKLALLALLRGLLERGQMAVLTLGLHGTKTDTRIAPTTDDGRVEKPVTTTWSDPSFGEDYFDIRALVASHHYDWLIRYTYEACALLRDLADELAATEPGFVLSDVIYGLELCNEIDLANIEPDNRLPGFFAYGPGGFTQSAQAWAALLVDMARIVEASFRSRGGVRILLPGMSSWDVEASDTSPSSSNYILTWSWKFGFFQALVTAFANQAGEDRGKLAHGVDLHWYHRQPRDAGRTAGPQHASRLAWELEQMYAALAQAGLDIDVTMFESGISVLEYNVKPESAGTVDYHPASMSDRVDTSALQLYQAQEVIRRLAGAAAGGATVAGWHTWRSGTEKEEPWYGLGLRNDEEDIEFNNRNPRMSWLGYQRFWSVLSSWSSASLVLPPEDFRPVGRQSAGHFSFSPDGSPDWLDGVVIEFRQVRHQGVALYRYAWLLMLDKWRGTGTVSLRCVPTSGASVTVQKVRLLPFVFDWTEASGDSELPQARATFRANRGISIPAAGMEWTLTIDSDPFLLLSTEKLEWYHVTS